MNLVRLLAFGDLDGETWGVSCIGAGDSAARLAIRRGETAVVLHGALEPAEPDEPGRLDGDGVSLVFAPTGPAGHGGADQLESVDQLCAVSGQVRIDGAEVEVRSLGWSSSVRADPEFGGLDSFRFVAAWLDSREGFSLLALRPRKARGQEADVVAAALVEDPPPRRVDEPRLSTSYTAAGLPARAGLELWLEEEPSDNAASDSSPQYPRRAAGETVGPGLEWDEDGFELHAALLRWHSHGREGPGVYLLGRRR